MSDPAASSVSRVAFDGNDYAPATVIMFVFERRNALREARETLRVGVSVNDSLAAEGIAPRPRVIALRTKAVERAEKSLARAVDAWNAWAAEHHAEARRALDDCRTVERSCAEILCLLGAEVSRWDESDAEAAKRAARYADLRARYGIDAREAAAVKTFITQRADTFRAPRAPSLDNLAAAVGLPPAAPHTYVGTSGQRLPALLADAPRRFHRIDVAPLARCYRDDRCPCDACVARDVDLVSAVANDRARRAADEAAALAKHGPAQTAETLGFAPIVTGSSPACATIEQLRRVLLGRGA